MELTELELQGNILDVSVGGSIDEIPEHRPGMGW